jgi:hypothetical protein
MHIVIRLAGGLGNQLFQLACANKIANISLCEKKKIKIDISYLSKYSQKRDFDANFLLEIFPNLKIGKLSFIEKFFSKLRIARFIDSEFGNYALISSTNTLRNLNGKKIKFVFLDGYFQDPYVIFPETERLKIFNFLNVKHQKLINLILKKQNSVAVHIRRGDYVQSKIFRLIPLDFYHQAINLISSPYNLFIFSDDKEIAALLAVKYGGLDCSSLGLSLEEEFSLLASCNHYIIANSTFSWWAAVLGQRNNGRIIAPSNWYRNQKSNKDNILLLSNFELINA